MALKITIIAIAFILVLANSSVAYADEGEIPPPSSAEKQIDVHEDEGDNSADEAGQADHVEQGVVENKQSLVEENASESGDGADSQNTLTDSESQADPATDEFDAEGEADSGSIDETVPEGLTSETDVGMDVTQPSEISVIDDPIDEEPPREVGEDDQQQESCNECSVPTEEDSSIEADAEAAPTDEAVTEAEIIVDDAHSAEEELEVEDEEPAQTEENSTPEKQSIIIPDPYFFVGNVKHSFLPSGGDCQGAANCVVSATPIQDAIDVVTGGLTPDDGTIYMEGGIYEENVSLVNLNIDLVLAGGADGRDTTIDGSFFIGYSIGRIEIRQIDFNAGFSVIGSDDVSARGNTFNSGVVIIDSEVDVEDSTLNAGMAVVNSSVELVNSEVNAGIAEINSDVVIIDVDQDGIADISVESSAVSVENTTLGNGASVQVENSTLDIAGTSGDDVIEVNLTGEGTNTVVIDGGEGADRLTLNLDGQSGDVEIADSGNSGNDSLAVNINSDENAQLIGAQVLVGNEVVEYHKVEDLSLSAEKGIELSGTILVDDQLTIVSEQGDIFQSDGKLAADRLILQAAKGIGSDETPIKTEVKKLAAQAVETGGVFVENEGGLIIAKIDDVVGVSAAGGGIGISTSGPLTICYCIKEAGGGDITLAANSNLKADSIVTINADISASGGNGNVTIIAEDDITQNSGSKISTIGTGDIDFIAGQRTNNAGITILGSVESESGAINLNATNGVTLGANAYIATSGELTINADSDGDGIGVLVLLESAAISIQNSSISIIAADIDLDGQIMVGDGDVNLGTSQENAELFIGFERAGFSLSTAELSRVFTTGSLTIGGETNQGFVTVDELKLVTAGYDLTILGGQVDLGEVTLALGMVLQLVAIGGIFDRNGDGRNITIPGGSLLIRAANFGTVADPIEAAVDMLSAQINLVGGTYISDLNHHDPPQTGLSTIAGLYIINVGNLTIKNQGISVDGEVFVSTTGRLEIAALIDASASVRLTAFELDIQADVQGAPVILNGVHAPGNSPGIDNITGDHTYGASDILQIEIGGLTPGPGTPTDNGYDQVNISGTATLNGTLEIILINSFSPFVGQTFDFLTYGTLSGSFANGAGLYGFGDGSLYFDVVDVPAENKLQLVVKEVSSSNDFAADLGTDADDFGEFLSDYFSDATVTVSGDLTLGSAVNLSGSYSFSKDGSHIEFGATGLTAFLGSGYGTVDEMGVKVTSAEGGVVVNSTGVATNISGSTALVGVSDITLSGTDMQVLVNTTGNSISESVPVGAGSVTVSFADGTEVIQFTGTLTGAVDGFVSLSGNLGFKKNGSEIVAVGTSVTAELESGTASVKLENSGFGFQTDGSAIALELKSSGAAGSNGFSATIDGFASVAADSVLVQYTSATGSVSAGTTLTVGSTSYSYSGAMEACKNNFPF